MKTLKRYRKLIGAVILIAVIILFFPEINHIYKNVGPVVEQSGSFAPMTYIALMIIAIIISPIPASPLTIFGGVLFGPWLGMLYTLIGATIGAILAFLIARFFLRDYISKQVEGNKFYQRIKGESNRNITGIILITRLMPHVSFDIVSYAAGLTSLNILVFAFVTFVGMIPIVFLLSFFGAVIQPYTFIFLLIMGGLFVFYFVYLTLTKSFKGESS